MNRRGPRPPRTKTAIALVAVLTTLSLAACGSESGVELVSVESTVASPTATVVTVPTAGPFNSDRISCTPEVVADPLVHNEVLKNVVRRFHDQLRFIPGVIGLGTTNLNTEIGGYDLAIQIHFDKAVHDKEPDSVLLIPSTIEGCRVNVKVIVEGRPL